MNKLAQILLALSSIAILTACKSIDMPQQKNTGFTSYEYLNTDFESDEIDQLIINSIDKELQNAGMSRSENAELLITFMTLKQNTASTSMSSSHFGKSRDAFAILEVAHKEGVIKKDLDSRVEQGAVLIDILNTNTNKLIYRNYAKRIIKDVEGTKEMEILIDNAVREALSAFLNN